MSYPEGCPTHSAYPAGHAAIAGAGATILKAFFKESFEIPNPVAASSDGLSLLPYSGEPLTIGGELNKLAANISLGRDTAGVHWRSDGIEGMKLGEAVAISILRDYRATYNEKFCGFSFTKFDGTPITIK
jgi:membrane-associated phospholipid phosphatase